MFVIGAWKPKGEMMTTVEELKAAIHQKYLELADAQHELEGIANKFAADNCGYTVNQRTKVPECGYYKLVGLRCIVTRIEGDYALNKGEFFMYARVYARITESDEHINEDVIWHVNL